MDADLPNGERADQPITVQNAEYLLREGSQGDLYQMGDALTFGRTSDGGAVAITVLSDGGREKAYAATQEELNALIVALATAYGLYQDGT